MLHRKISFLLLIFSYSLNAQSLNDFLKISIDNPVGSARFESMGGAFGALGGDLSAINVNPAGSAVFNDNQYEFTLSNSKKSTKSYYYSDTSVKIKISLALIKAVEFGFLKTMEEEMLIKFLSV